MATANFGPMCNELSRLGTYSGFQAPLGVWPLQLAQAGFCRDRTCNDVEVVCFLCGLKLDVRTLPKQPVLEIHRVMAPLCSFAMGSSRNQPVSLAPLTCGASQLRTNQDYVHSIGTTFSLPPNWGSPQSQLPAFSSLPRISESFSQVLSPRASESVPQVTDRTSRFSFSEEMDFVSVSDPFSQVSSIPGLGDISQTLSSDTLEPSVLPSLPSDFLSNFENTFLSSEVLPDVLLEGYSNPQSLTNSGVENGGSSNLRHAAYFSQSQSGVVLGAPGEVMVTDGDALEPEVTTYVVEAAPAEAQAFSKPSPPTATPSAATPEQPAKRTVTFDDLGIVVQRPKRQDYATVPVRLATFGSNWKKKGQYQTKEIMAEAGFYYAGYADCCRCFYCGGGLKNWENEDHPWIEHSRWFKNCPYVTTNWGQDFITAVQSLSDRRVIKISWSDVEEEIKRLKPEADQTTNTSEVSLPQRPDSQTSLDCENVVEDGDGSEAAKQLESENDMLKQANMCKVCLDREVSILYVPCGHLVTCSICAPSMSNCPVCRQRVKGQVRVTVD